MEKIKITVEQEEVLKKYIKYCKVNDKDAFRNFVRLGKYWIAEWTCLSFFNPADFSLLLHGWYELEQPFKVGDWIEKENHYFKISQFIEDEMSFTNGSWDFIEKASDYKKVIESWKLMLLDLGREKPEFQAGDIVETESDCYSVEENDEEDFFEEVIMLFEKDLVKAFHAAENRIEVPKNV